MRGLSERIRQRWEFSAEDPGHHPELAGARPVRAGRGFLYILLVGLVLAGTSLVVIFTTTDPVKAPPDSPVLVSAGPPSTETSTTTTTTTTVAPEPETTVAPAPRPAKVRSTGGARPQAPPKNPYAAEPIVEIGTIEIPRIGLSHRIWQGISMRNIDNGPSHWPGTALPGEVGNAVFAGHRVTHSKPFRNIDQLDSGDQVIFTVNDVRSVYEVIGKEIVEPTALRIVQQTDTPTATLFACHPPGSARQRYVVHLALVAG